MIKLSIQFSFDWIGKKRLLHRSSDEQSFNVLAQHIIDSISDTKAKSTIDNYNTALRSFCSFAGCKLLLGDISIHTIEGYQRWLLKKGIALNTVSCYMRSLRSLIHKIQPDTDTKALFATVFTGNERTEKRAVSADDIGTLCRMKLPQQSTVAYARDIFLFSFYALGMPFVDVVHLRKSQVNNGYIVYHRHKTGQRISIKIEPPMQQIMNRYNRADCPFVFPMLSADDDLRQETQYETLRSLYNHHLCKLGQMAHIHRRLTSYVARHSWASIAYHANVDLSVISKAMGHTSPNTTLTYIRSIDDDRIDTANHMLLQQIV